MKDVLKVYIRIKSIYKKYTYVKQVEHSFQSQTAEKTDVIRKKKKAGNFVRN